MSIQRKTPRKVTVTPPDPKYTEKDIRKQHLRVAPYCRVSTGNEEQLTSFTAQMEYYTQRIAGSPAGCRSGSTPPRPGTACGSPT